MLSTTYLIFLFLIYVQVQCDEFVPFNPPNGSCWPLSTKPDYEQFIIKYHFSSRTNRDQIYLSNQLFSPQSYDFDPRKRTTVVVHGFMGSGTIKWVNDLRDSLLEWVSNFK